MKILVYRTVFLKILLVALAVFAMWRGWNWLFLQYIESTKYQSDFFREIMQTRLSPIYGAFSVAKLPLWAILPSFIFGVFLYKRQENWIAQPKAIYWIMAFQCLFSLSFGLTDGKARWLENDVHFTQFANGLPFCHHSFVQLFSNYAAIMAMPNLGSHLNHYPPGNLFILLVAEKIGFVGFAKMVNLLFSVMTCFQIKKIAKLLDFEIVTTNFALLLYATTVGVLIFPSVDFAALLPFFGCTMLACFLKMWTESRINLSLGFGVSTAFFIFFSFNFPLIFGFIAVFIFIAIFKSIFLNKENKLDLVFFAQKNIAFFLVNLVFVFLVYHLLFLATGFDMLNCFATSIPNNAKLISYHAFDSFPRYLLRSTGNILAYLMGSLGIFITSLIIFIKKSLKNDAINEKSTIFALTSIIILVLASFSTLFVGETERIWLYFTPFLCLSAAITLKNWKKIYGLELTYLIIFLNLLYSVFLEIFFVHAL